MYPTEGTDEEWAVLEEWTMKDKELAWPYFIMAFRIKAGYFKNASFHSQSLIKDNYEKAALLGNVVGMVNLGLIYANGSFGVDRCYKKAVLWWTKAAVLGDSVSIRCLEMLSNSKQLIDACATGKLSEVKMLLKRATNANFQRGDGRTPLSVACGNGFVEIVNVLLARELIQINQSLVDGAIPLFVACQNGRVTVVKILLARQEIQITAEMLAFSTLVLEMDRICTSGDYFESTKPFYEAFAKLGFSKPLDPHAHLPTDLVRYIFRFFGCPENKRCTHKMILAQHHIWVCEMEQLCESCSMMDVPF
jgi:hypothetical protein